MRTFLRASLTAVLLCGSGVASSAPLPLPPSKSQYGWTEPELMAPAQSGNVEAQYLLGQMYVSSGRPAVAEPWLRKAAEGGNHKAQAELGYLNLFGKGIPQNNAEAFKWLEKASDHVPLARTRLGQMYQLGVGVQKEMTRAILYYTISASENEPEASLMLGNLRSQGVPGLYERDPAIAVRMWTNAAAGDNAMGAVQLGFAYANGNGVAKNMALGHALVSRGVATEPQAKDGLDAMARDMTPNELVTAKKFFDDLRYKSGDEFKAKVASLSQLPTK